MPRWKSRNTKRARALRNTATPAECALWRHLSRSQLGAKFSRQMQVGPFFADFLCRELKLVVELDGFSHDCEPERDVVRDGWFKRAGYSVLHFNNEDALQNPEGVTAAIRQEIVRLTHPRPLPQAGGEAKIRPDSPPACGRGGQNASGFPSRLRERLGVGQSYPIDPRPIGNPIKS